MKNNFMRFGLRRFRQGAISVLVMIILALAVLAILWQVYRHDLMRSEEFAVSVDKISISPKQPDWIKEDVLRTVVRQHNLDDLYLDDHNLTKQIADAFTLHSWVASVASVKKDAAGIIVQLSYRKPVAMVEVRFNNRPHVLPVDGTGVVLPPNDFVAEDISKYLRISADHLGPNGITGDPWGDKKVLGAAKLAQQLNTLDWKSMELYRIEATLNPESGRMVFYLVLRKPSGVRVLWGSEPGDELENEEIAPEKLKELWAFFRANQTLKISVDPAEIDLRGPDGVIVVPLRKMESGEKEN